MVSNHLDHLPRPVLELICEFLVAEDDPRRDSLIAFSLTSRNSHAASARELFRRVVFRMDHEDFQRKLDFWTSLSDTDSRLKCVHEIVITDDRLRIADTWGDPHFQKIKHVPSEPEIAEKNLLFNTHLEWPHPPRLRFPWDRERCPELDSTWSLLVRLLHMTPRISEFVFDLNVIMPSSLLNALHQNHSKCRLHIPNFILPSLYQARQNLHGMDKYELELATSKCLYSIGLRYCDFDEAGRIDYHREAILQILKGANTNLRNLVISNEFYHDSLDFVGAVTLDDRPPARDFFDITPEKSDHLVGQLNSLVLLDGYKSKELQSLSRFADLPYLQSIQIKLLDTMSIQTLEQMAFNSKINTLCRLDLTISSRGHPEQDQALISLLRTLQPLSVLKLSGDLPQEIFSAIMQNHGSTLTELQLLPRYIPQDSKPQLSINQEEIQMLVTECPNLQILSFQFRRTKGDKNETTKYRTLGRIPKLKHLSLTLDCTVPEYKLFTTGPLPKDQARDFLVNSAIDQALANSIYKTIYGSTQNRRFVRQCLILDIASSMTFPRSDPLIPLEFETLIDWIRRRWICERYFDEQIKIREVDASGREYKNMYNDCFQEPDISKSLSVNGAYYEDIWKSIWPVGTGNWRNDWASWPLWMEDETAKE